MTPKAPVFATQWSKDSMRRGTRWWGRPLGATAATQVLAGMGGTPHHEDIMHRPHRPSNLLLRLLLTIGALVTPAAGSTGPGQWTRVTGHRLYYLRAGTGSPVLLIAGDHDLIRLEHILEIYRALPNAQLFIVPDTGHGTFESRPTLVNPVLLEFLGRPQ